MNRQKLVLLTVAGALAVATGSAAAQAPKPATAGTRHRARPPNGRDSSLRFAASRRSATPSPS